MDYRITVTTADLTQNYGSVSEPWEFLFTNDDGSEVWEAKTSQIAAFESLLNTDSTIVKFSNRESLRNLPPTTAAQLAGVKPFNTPAIEREYAATARRNGDCDCGHCFDCVAQ